MSTNRNVEDIYPLSPLQEGMLFHALYRPELGMYSEQFPLLVTAPLDADALERAYHALVRRHAALRTGFVWDGVARPLQVVSREVRPIVERLDWRGQADWQARLHRLMADDRRRGYDLKHAPLHRMVLAALPDGRHVMMLGAHHLLFDGWSLPLLLGELDALYRAERTGRPADLPPAPRYRDYIGWLLRQDTGRAEAFWRGALAGVEAATPLPLDRGGQRVAERHAMESLWLEGGEGARLQAFARDTGITFNTLVQAAWAVVLASGAGTDDVVFGATLSGRPGDLPGVERMVGLFINTLPVRVRFPAGARVGPWLAELQAAQAEARQHEYARLVDVQGWTEVPREQQLFESVLVFENYPLGDGGDDDDTEGLGLAGLEIEERSNYPLSLVVAPGESTVVRMTYDVERFSADDARRILGRMRAALLGLAAGADRPLADVSPLTGEETALLDGWSRGVPFTHAAPLHRLFEAQAAATPDAPAIRYEGRTVTYAELDARANRIAGLLREMGVGPETRVALCLERGPDQAACALAVVKAGGAFVPLDPAHPRDRRAWLMADSGASLLVATRDLADGLPEAPRVLVLDEAEDRIAAASPASPEVEVPLEAAAYVVYTSGSTGTPKGVLVPHRGIGAMHGFADAMDVGPGSRLLQFYSFSFDMFVMETTVGLTRGACLVMGNPERMRPGPDLVALMRSERVTQSLISPAVLAVMPEGELPDLHTIISGGEALPPETVTRWGAGRRLLNGYGPTECTMGATVSGPVDGERRPPIGRAIPGYTTWVLDPEMRPSPVGAPGELYLGGVGVARGYLGRPGLTAERFVPDPYGGEPGARLYRSGDRVAWRGDGQLDFLGRVDEQVKIRGHRIEPREVEAVLRAHPDVHAAAVIAREDRGEKRLVGYVVAREGADPSPGALREHVAARLPNAMVPSAVVRIERIPLNTHGKLDVRALPAPDLSDSGTEHVPPRTPTEQALAALWAELLGVPRVGAEDSFFDLGGHSLLATRLVSALRLKLDVELPLRDVFDAPRLSQLADRIDVVQAESLAALGAELEGLSEDELRTLLDETAAAAAPAEQG